MFELGVTEVYYIGGIPDSIRNTYTAIKGVAGKKFREGRTRFGGGGTPKNLKFRYNHKGPPCELFWDPGYRGGGGGRPQLI